MEAVRIWKAVVEDRVNFLDTLLALLRDHGVRYCVIGGQGVNAYAEPLVSLDLDLVVAAADVQRVENLLNESWRVERFAHGLRVSAPGSDLRVQIQTDPRYASFVDRASLRDVLGVRLPVASVEDVLQGKVWAALDPARRATKRRKDLLDIERLLEAHPQLGHNVPCQILEKLADV